MIILCLTTMTWHLNASLTFFGLFFTSQAKSSPDGDLDLDPDRDFAVPESEPLGDRDTDFDCDLAQLGLPKCYNLIDLVRLQSLFSILQLLQSTLQGLKWENNQNLLL